MKTIRFNSLNAGALAFCLAVIAALNPNPSQAQGSLTPSGGPSPMFKTLQQIEPRMDVNRLTGDGSATRIISQPGSYYLTSNLVGVAFANGISIRTNNVTLDLNGFALIGVSNSLDGINATLVRRNIEIRSGNTEGWGGDGVDTMDETDVRLFNIRSSRNGGNGFNLGPRSVVTECQAAENTIHGIQIMSGVVQNCTVVGNGYSNGVPTFSHGIEMIGMAESGVIKDCVANYNSADGFNIGGFFPGSGSIISGCTAKGNLSDGIQIGSHNYVRNNNCLTNGVSGIHVEAYTSGSRIEDNHVSLHPIGYLCDFGTVDNILMKNTSQGNGPGFGYVVPPGNHLAAITFFPALASSESALGPTSSIDRFNPQH